MAGVGLGTVPALLLSAAFGTMLSAVWRRHVARVAGVLLIAFAALTIARGFGVPVMRHLRLGPATPTAQDAPCH
jgi:sulfite exporter TauE/SafE